MKSDITDSLFVRFIVAFILGLIFAVTLSPFVAMVLFLVKLIM